MKKKNDDYDDEEDLEDTINTIIDDNVDNVKNHHVAWKDRIGLNRVWEKDVLVCSETFGTDNYRSSVNRFRNDIININDGPNLRDMINDYVNITLRDWKIEQFDYWASRNKQESIIPEICNKVNNEIEDESCKLLYNYMLQLLEDNGFLFYKSNVEEDEMQ